MRGTGALGCRFITSCSEGNGGCDPRAACISGTPGGALSQCGECQPGFLGLDGLGGDLACIDVDACDASTGDQGAAGGSTAAATSRGFVAADAAPKMGQCDPESVGCADTPGDYDPTGKQYNCKPCRPGFAGVRHALRSHRVLSRVLPRHLR